MKLCFDCCVEYFYIIKTNDMVVKFSEGLADIIMKKGYLYDNYVHEEVDCSGLHHIDITEFVVDDCFDAIFKLLSPKIYSDAEQILRGVYDDRAARVKADKEEARDRWWGCMYRYNYENQKNNN